MVLITDGRDGGGSSPRKVKPDRHTTSIGNPAQIYPTIIEEPPDPNDEDEYLGLCDDEELGDFYELPDTRSIVSDDSFYPPDDDSMRTPSPESPPHLSFYQACYTNNAFTVKLMIRQGLTEEDVQETDKNKRVSTVGINVFTANHDFSFDSAHVTVWLYI